jgi:kynurenine formamidase
LRFEEIIHGKKYDLGFSLDKATPVWPSHPPFFMTLNNRHGDVPDPRNCGYGSANEIIIMSGHHSTHIDALGHVSDCGVLHGNVTATDIQHGKGQQRGLTSHGVEAIEPVMRRGVLLDIPTLKGKGRLDAGEPVMADDLSAAAEAQQVTVQPGDCVLIRTGWAQHYENNQSAYLAQEGGLPGPDVSAGLWLAEKKVFLAGSDNIVFEQVVPGSPGLPVHQELIARNGIHIVECLNLEDLAKDRVYEFLFIAIPLKITGATGSPIRPIAVV